ncbi:4362_t:CDS:2, partial [Entrophospora sp. SA101]
MIDVALSDTPYTYIIEVRRLVWPVLKEKTDTGPWQYIGPTQQKAIGKKGDAYVRMFGSTSTGWVASEAGQKWEGAHGTKFMEETSLSAVLMMVCLDCLAGYFCRHTRRNSLEVYTDVNNFSKSLDVLIEIIYAK